MKNILIILCCAFSIILEAQQPVNGPSNQSFNYNSIVNSAYNPGNGTADISIPIASIGEGSISHSVALVANTDAPKVGEMASTVGLGWSLMGGGMISRSIRSLPDDEEDGYYIEGGYGIDIEDVKNGDRDSEPDMYFFNAGSLSGSFTIDEDGDFHTIPKSRIKIEVELDGTENFTNFIITDDIGVKYYFGLPDENFSYHGLERNIGTNDVTGWMLNKIESLDAELLFEYEVALSSTLYISEQLIHTYVDINNNSEIINSDLIKTGNLIDTDNVFRAAHIMTFVPSRIISSTKTIEFIYNNDRDDIGNPAVATTDNGGSLVYGKRLTEIKIVEGDIVDCTKFVLNQTYFVDNSTPISAWNYLPRVSKRLKFDNIIQKSCSGLELPTTTIEYYGESNGTFFPNQFHTDIDDWGYYNAADNGANLIKAGFSVQVNNWVANPLTILLPSPGEANRLPKLDATKNGAIKKITYPMGGTVSYEYELNTESEVLLNTELFNLTAFTLCDENLPECCDWIYSNYTPSIFFSSDIIETGTFTLNLDPFFPSSCDPLNSELVLTVYDPNLTSEVASISLNYNPPISDQTFLTVNVSEIAELESQQYYRFRLKSRNANSGTYAKLDVPMTMSNSPVGGLRVSKITTHDGLDSSNDIVVEYDYSDGENTLISSGKSFLPHDLYYNIPLDITPQVIFHYSPQHSFHNFYGSHITYERVKTINHDRGYSISKLKSISENYEAKYPLVPQPYNNQLGFLETSEVYNSEDELLSKNTNVQNDDDLFNIHSTEIYALRIAPFYDYFSDAFQNDQIYKSDYSIKNGISRIKNNTTHMDGQEYTTEYTYFTGDDAEKCYAPQYTKIVDINGDVYKNKHKYTFKYDIDFVSSQNNDGDASYCIHAKLNEMNIVGLKWQTESFHNGTLVNGSRSKFKLYDNSTGERVICNSNSSSNTSLKLWKNFRIENTWINGLFVNNGWQPISEIVRYDRIEGGGKLRSPEKTIADGWQNYTENVYDNLNRLTETKKVTIASGAQPTIQTTYNYLGTSGLLSSTIAPDGTSAAYDYDEFLRKYKGTDCYGVETTITYDINGIVNNTPDNVISTSTNYALNTINTDPDGLSAITMLESKNYLDGLGRSVQKIGVNQSQDGMMDMVSIMEYDDYGNSTKSYFQYESSPGNNGSYTSPPSNLVYGTQNYDDSPLNRVESGDPPGELGIITQEYGSNESSDLVLYYDNPSVVYYDPGDLKKAASIDQNGHRSIVFTDIFGRKILSRRAHGTNPNERSDTYYLYDAKHRLIKVIPPGADPATTPDLIYEYSYYGNNNMRSKKIPGADEVLYIYNNRELLAATQDGNMRAEDSDKWMAYEYDEHGRTIKTGFIYQTLVNESFDNPAITEILSTHSFYSNTHRPERDEYKILGASDFLYTDYNYNSCGDLTGTVSNTFEDINQDFYFENFDYDEMGNIIEKSSLLVNSESNVTRTFKERFKFDASGRLTETLYSYDNGSWKPISALVYDDQERISTKYHGNTNGNWLQKIDYTYTDFGQLKYINGNELVNNDINVDYHGGNPTFGNTTNLDERDLFQQELVYNGSVPSNFIWSGITNNTENGNIKAVIWQNRGKRQAGYIYGYTYKNELESAEFYKENSNNIFSGTGEHSAYFDYSANGTITDITRNNINSVTQINNSLIPNSVFIEDMTIDNTTYAQQYDANGNMKNYKNYRFEYNHLNLPTHKFEQEQLIIIDPGSGDAIIATGPITTLASYQYLADGSKLQNWTFNTTYGENTKFIGVFEKFTSFETEKLRVMFDGGYLSIDQATNAVIEEVYSISDHLGNVRVSYSDINQNGEIDNTTEVKGINDFYPYGKRINHVPKNTDLLYGYNGIENDRLIEDFDLSLAAYRSLNAETGMWLQVDPKAEAAYGHSPYNSMFNNPISMSDPEGDLPFLAIVGIGAVTGIFSNGLSNVSQGQGFFNGAGGAALWGGIGAAASFGVGSIFGATGSIGNELGRAGAHALSGGVQSHLQGGSFGQGLLSGGMSSIIGSSLSGAGAGAQIFGSGIGGGAGSVMSGGNFFGGFGQGVAVGAFNHALHSGAAAIDDCCPGLPPGKEISDYSPSAQMAIMTGRAQFDELGNFIGVGSGDSFAGAETGVPAWKQAIDLFSFGTMRVPGGELWVNLSTGISQKGGTFASKLATYLKFGNNNTKTFQQASRAPNVKATKLVVPEQNIWRTRLTAFSRFLGIGT